MMVLFSISHTELLSKTLLLRFTEFANENCTLLWLGRNHSTFDQSLVKNHIFQKVVPFDFLIEDPTKTQDDYEAKIVQYYEKLFKENGIELTQCTSVITGGDLDDAFNLYCCLKGISYKLLESYPSELINKNRLNFHKGRKHQVNLQSIFSSLLGENEFCVKRYLIPDGTPPVRKNDTIINFEELFYQIPPKKQKDIVTAFQLYNLQIENLILLNSSGWTGSNTKMIGAKMYIPYQIMVDLFFHESDKITVKAHPMSNQLEFDDVFYDFDKVEGITPIELFKFKENFQINKVVSGSGSALTKIKRHITNEVRLHPEWPINHKILLQIYTIFRFIKILEQKKIVQIFNIQSILIDTFFREVIDFKELGLVSKAISNMESIPGEDNTITIFKDLGNSDYNKLKNVIQEITNNSIIFFIETENFMNLNIDVKNLIYDFFIPIVNKKNQKKEKVLCELNAETIYIFTKSPELRKKIMNFSFRKTLKYTGIELYVDPTTEEEVAQRINELKLQALSQQISQIQTETMTKIQLLSEEQGKHLATLNNYTDEKFNSLLNQQGEQNKVINQSTKNLEIVSQNIQGLQQSMKHLETSLIKQQQDEAERSQYLEIHKDTLYAKYYEKIERKYPKGSKKREFWKKVAEKFI